MNIRIMLIFCVWMLLSACANRSVSHDGRLEMIASMVSDSPSEAVDQLAGIDRADLSEKDRHFYDLLTIKARDKAYMDHSSDSLVLTVVEYYSSHREEDLYPEALYYAGRVYSDLGDAPTALRYFQQALDAIPDKTDYRKLRSTVLSQTGRLLERVRLYDEAKPVLKDAISLNAIERDTMSLSSNLELLGIVYKHQEMSDSAMECFNKSLALTPASRMAKVFIAEMESARGNVSEAVDIIRNLRDSVEDDEKSYVTSTAALIYNEAGLMDSVYHLAIQLTQQDKNSHIGYFLLSQEGMRKYVNQDSLTRYMQAYVAHTEKQMNEIEREKILMQETSYNYRRYERERNRALEENLTLKNRLIVCMVVIFVVLTALLVFVIYKLRNKLRVIRLLYNIGKIRRFKESASVKEAPNNETNVDASDVEDSPQEEMADDESNESDSKVENSSQEEVADDESNESDSKVENFSLEEESCIDSHRSISEIRELLHKDLRDLEECDKFYLSEEFLNSDVHKELQTLMSLKKPIPPDSDLFTRVEKLIHASHPNFKNSLVILTDGKLKPTDYTISLLMKCGMSTTEMSCLLARAKNTISTRKDNLSKKIFNEKRPSKELELIIHYI